ncbi:MAG: prepilin-type N-terminal cleavage/methylation domain-containing protein [Sedimentisphaerales bacterium]|nr:prepilin-type N-terminal cleavage/methylation domain-containing protein [Sedimentisphaerales bacterium]
MIKRTNIKGLTLVELLIVVAIIVAVTAIAVPRVSQSATSTKASACRTNIKLLNSAIEQYNLDNGSYPENLFDVSRNKIYFPDGEPVCPVTGLPYLKNLNSSFRVDEVGHLHAAAVSADDGNDDDDDDDDH